MRNLKKFLALVLALMMVVSVMVVTVSAKDFTDKDEINPDYLDAVNILSGIGVFEGTDDTKTVFSPDLQLTRNQVAAIIYRVMTGDVAGENIGRYATYAQMFKDVDMSSWYPGYVGYVANGKIVVGNGAGQFMPSRDVTGYELLTICLRALGYGKNGEYEGDGWQVNVAKDSTTVGLIDGVTTSLSNAFTREEVAQVIYNTVTSDMVSYTTLNGYRSLGTKLVSWTKGANKDDDWGAPAASYTSVSFNYPLTPVAGDDFTVADEPVVESYEPMTQASVYAALKMTGPSGSLATYVNGVKSATNTTVAAATTSLTGLDVIGGQGRWTRVYKDRIVYVDTFLSAMGTVTQKVEVNGKTAVPASYTAATYYNNYAQTAPAGIRAYQAPNSATPATSYTEDYLENFADFATGDMVASNAIASADQTTGKFDSNNKIASLVNAKKANSVNVTVNAIVRDNNNLPTGIIGTDGKTYLYNCTYAYNAAEWADTTWASTGRTSAAPTKLERTDIGKTYTLYLDEHDNILGVALVAGTADTGYGVVTDSDAYRNKGGEYAGQLTVLKSDGSTATVRFLNSTAYYTTEEAAASAAAAYMGDLIQWSPNTTAPATLAGYSTITDATITGNGTATQGKIPVNIPGTELNAGDADALIGAGAPKNALLNDKTVFFIANYTMENSQGGYVFSNYSIVTGYKNIPDLGCSGTVVSNPGNVGTGNSVANNIKVMYEAFTSNNWVTYVLVINAVNKNTDDVVPVANYAYLADPNAFVKVYNNYYQYDAVLNGAAHQPLQVRYEDTNRISATGMYTYDTYTNEGWKNITLSPNHYDNGAYGYKDGVLYNNTVVTNATQFYAVVNDCPIHLVNPETGDSTQVNATLDVIHGAYPNGKLWFQTNQYGFVDRVYVETTEAATEGTAPTSIRTISFTTVSGASISPSTSGTLVDARLTSGDPNNYSVSAYWEKLGSDGNYVRYYGQAFTAGTYRLVVVATAKGNNVFDNNTKYTGSITPAITLSPITGSTKSATLYSAAIPVA